MESRASIPPGLPKPDPTTSYWQQPPDPIADCRTTDEIPEHADIVIVGSGISGSTIAYQLLSAEPGKKIVMFEARQAASGASGRNGGHTKGASYRTIVENAKAFGEEDAVRIAKLEYDCMAAVHDFIRDQDIDCDSRRCDTVDVFYSEKEFKRAHQSVAFLKSVIEPSHPASKYSTYDAADTAKLFLSEGSFGSVRYEAGSLSAYKLTIWILKLALQSGLNLQCNTPVNKITKGANSWSVDTDRGSITADKVILATNGYTAHLYKKLQGVIVPFRGIVTAQRPGNNMPQTGLETTFSFIYDKGYEYMITRPNGTKFEGDIVIGGGLTKGSGVDGMNEYGTTDDTSIDPDIKAYLKDCTADFFGSNWGEDNEAGRLRHTWSGIMGYSGDGCPLVGPVPNEEGLFIDASFQGHGMVLCFLCAKAVCQMVLGKDGPELDSWFPQCFRMSERRLQAHFKGRKGASTEVHEATTRD